MCVHPPSRTKCRDQYSFFLFIYDVRGIYKMPQLIHCCSYKYSRLATNKSDVHAFKSKVSALEHRGTKQNNGLGRLNYIALRLQGQVGENNDEHNSGQTNYSVFCLTLPTMVTTPGTSPSWFPTWTCHLSLVPNSRSLVMCQHPTGREAQGTRDNKHSIVIRVAV